MPRLAFLFVPIALMVLVHYYVWRRMVRDTMSSTRARRYGAVALGVLLLSMIGAFVGSRADFLPESVVIAVSWVGYVWAAVLLYLVLTLFVLEPLRWLVGRKLKPRVHAPAVPKPEREPEPAASSSRPTSYFDKPAPPAMAVPPAEPKPPADPEPSTKDAPSPDRRAFLARSLALAAGTVAAGTVGYGLVTALGKPRVEHVPMTLSKLSPSLDGFRIGVVSDIHIGPFTHTSRVAEIVNMLNKLDVDVVTIVGDLVDGSVERMGKYARPLQDITAKHGAFFVTGNHEFYSGVEDWVEYLPEVGVRVLRNERVLIKVGDAAFDLAGVDDVSAQEGDFPGFGPDLGKALRGRDLSRPVVLLAHQPVFFDKAVEHGVDLQLSGHTHGGQMFPVQALTLLDSPVVSGRYDKERSQLYVTRGTGFWGPPVRVGAPPEITVVHLKAPR